MANHTKFLKLLLGILIGFFISHLVQYKSKLCRFVKVQEEVVTPLAESRLQNSKNEADIFVGVMTASKYLETRAKAIHETWGESVPGKLVFFSSETSYSKTLPLVSLIDIDDSYPPQKKSFAMLKYMHDNYIDQYEWFMRADDDVYVRMDRLETLLRSVDSRKPWFIGQTGRGNNDEFGLLSLEHDENFCMGGPGVILSKETLKRIAPYMEQCLSNLFTTHEDVELGRCVKKFAGVSCTWSYDMQVILYHNQSGEAAFSGNLKQREVHRAITLHPVKQPHYMHRLHRYVKGLKIQEYRHQSLVLHRDILSSYSFVKDNINKESESNVENILFSNKESVQDSKLLGEPLSLVRFKSKQLKDISEWELFAKSLFSPLDLNPRKRLGSTIKEGLSDIIREVMELINLHSKQRGRVIDFKDVFYGYWRLDPVFGVDLILDLLLVYRKYRGHKMTVPVRRHAYIQQSFTGIDIREIVENTSQKQIPFHKKMFDSLNISFLSKNSENHKYITFILPLKGRFNTFKRFIRIYTEVCVKKQEPTKLIVVLYQDKIGIDFNNTVDLIKKIKQNSSILIDVIYVNEHFSRGKALQYGAQKVNSNDLMLFIDADIIFNSNMLLQVRLNTVRNKSVYFPIVYSLYNPNVFNKTYMQNYEECDNFDNLINEENGFWRQFGFGIVSLYKSDFINIGGFNTSIVGWGLEDVNFYDNVLKSEIKVVRCVNPSIIHVFHQIDCDNLDGSQKTMCLGTKSSLPGSLHDLEQYVLSNMNLVR